ncbi:hypothetical protein Zmor_008449 [Zophobas morio]|uniref:Uncharacterized protein n=1 Tax=Zophobas morio TaxID=2755281 RepID=A0AA38MQC9_9CUCU|nr:hypothetical protein Zmor_008449 [Zophobas morio]
MRGSDNTADPAKRGKNVLSDAISISAPPRRRGSGDPLMAATFCILIGIKDNQHGNKARTLLICLDLVLWSDGRICIGGRRNRWRGGSGTRRIRVEKESNNLQHFS